MPTRGRLLAFLLPLVQGGRSVPDVLDLHLPEVLHLDGRRFSGRLESWALEKFEYGGWSATGAGSFPIPLPSTKKGVVDVRIPANPADLGQASALRLLLTAESL